MPHFSGKLRSCYLGVVAALITSACFQIGGFSALGGREGGAAGTSAGAAGDTQGGAGFGGFGGGAGEPGTAAGTPGVAGTPGAAGANNGATCGNNQVEPGEECDDGNAINTDACVRCKQARCGDGLVQRGVEACDDGNRVTGDGCGVTCRRIVGLTAGAYQSCVLLDDANIECWGLNKSGQLGLEHQSDIGDQPGEMNNLRVDLGTNKHVIGLSLSSDHSCATLSDFSMKCWGGNTNGDLGQGDTRPRGIKAGEMGDALPQVLLGTSPGVVSAITGFNFSCAIIRPGSVKCWGFNQFGKLGSGDTADQGATEEAMQKLQPLALGAGRTALYLAPGGDYHNCAILDNNSVKCWGRNDYGQLGIGSEDAKGDNPNEMGDALPAVDLGTGKTARQIGVGRFFTCALLNDGNVKCWGDNASGQLGIGDAAPRGKKAAEMGDALPTVKLGTGRTALMIDVNFQHSCALLDNGSVKCWGLNKNGELGLGDPNSRGLTPQEMGDNLPAVNLGTDRQAKVISTGAEHTCALLDNATVKCWGLNHKGQLGLGDLVRRGAAPNEMGDKLPTLPLP